MQEEQPATPKKEVQQEIQEVQDESDVKKMHLSTKTISSEITTQPSSIKKQLQYSIFFDAPQRSKLDLRPVEYSQKKEDTRFSGKLESLYISKEYKKKDDEIVYQSKIVTRPQYINKNVTAFCKTEHSQRNDSKTQLSIGAIQMFLNKKEPKKNPKLEKLQSEMNLLLSKTKFSNQINPQNTVKNQNYKLSFERMKTFVSGKDPYIYPITNNKKNLNDLLQEPHFSSSHIKKVTAWRNQRASIDRLDKVRSEDMTMNQYSLQSYTSKLLHKNRY